MALPSPIRYLFSHSWHAYPLASCPHFFRPCCMDALVRPRPLSDTSRRYLSPTCSSTSLYPARLCSERGLYGGAELDTAALEEAARDRDIEPNLPPRPACRFMTIGIGLADAAAGRFRTCCAGLANLSTQVRHIFSVTNTVLRRCESVVLRIFLLFLHTTRASRLRKIPPDTPPRQP